MSYLKHLGEFGLETSEDISDGVIEYILLGEEVGGGASAPLGHLR